MSEKLEAMIDMTHATDMTNCDKRDVIHEGACTHARTRPLAAAGPGRPAVSRVLLELLRRVRPRRGRLRDRPAPLLRRVAHAALLIARGARSPVPAPGQPASAVQVKGPDWHVATPSRRESCDVRRGRRTVH